MNPIKKSSNFLSALTSVPISVIYGQALPREIHRQPYALRGSLLMHKHFVARNIVHKVVSQNSMVLEFMKGLIFDVAKIVNLLTKIQSRAPYYMPPRLMYEVTKLI